MANWVLNKIGKVVYCLNLPPSSKIDPVIHVSQLNQALMPADAVHGTLPAFLGNRSMCLFIVKKKYVSVPVKILQQLPYQKGGFYRHIGSSPIGLINASLATWEDYNKLRHRFPEALTFFKGKPSWQLY